MDAESNSTFFYQPPPGGDISLKSSDGVVFLAHSLLLRLASSAFADMFSTATHNDMVELTDDAESVSLMLRFIYPPAFADDLPITLLEKSLCIAQKYDVTGNTTSIDQLMSHSSNKGSLICSDPVRAFCLAAKYGLPKTHKAAREVMRPGGFEFKDPKQIKPLVETFPSASSAIEIFGALWGDAKHMMVCESCFAEWGYEFEEGGHYEPSWLSHWCAEALHRIATRPFKECDPLFQITILETIAPRAGVCRDCIGAARDAIGGLVFDSWAHGVRLKVEKILSEAERLYNL